MEHMQKRDGQKIINFFSFQNSVFIMLTAI